VSVLLLSWVLAQGIRTDFTLLAFLTGNGCHLKKWQHTHVTGAVFVLYAI
jgi:hypothetical protein